MVASAVPYAEILAATGIPKKTAAEWAQETPGAVEARARAKEMRAHERAVVGTVAVAASAAGVDSAREVVRRVGLAGIARAEALLPGTMPEQAPALMSSSARAVSLAEGWAAKEQVAAMGAGAQLAIAALLTRLVERGALPADEAEQERRKVLEAAGEDARQSGQVVKVYIGRDLREAIR